jgi:hypothetical protein
MRDENTLSLSAVWMSGPSASDEEMTTAIGRVLDKDREARDSERRWRIGGLLAMACLVPTTMWAAVYGATPLVRAAYALMTVGTALLVAAEWMYLEWSRRALPGPADARSQLQTIAFMIGRQIMLTAAAPILTAPIFVGAVMIGAWLYRERTHEAAIGIWTIVGACWSLMAWGVASLRAKLIERRLHTERILSELK